MRWNAGVAPPDLLRTKSAVASDDRLSGKASVLEYHLSDTAFAFSDYPSSPEVNLTMFLSDMSANRQWQWGAGFTFIIVLGGIVASCLTGGAEFNPQPMIEDKNPSEFVDVGPY